MAFYKPTNLSDHFGLYKELLKNNLNAFLTFLFEVISLQVAAYLDENELYITVPCYKIYLLGPIFWK